MCSRRLALALAAGLALVSACGKKGPPLPPLRAVPAPTQDLAVRQRGAQLLLSFTYPTSTPGGQALAGISSVEVYEVARPLPPKAPADSAPPAEGAAAEPAPAAPAAPTTDAQPEPLDPREFAAGAEKVLALASADIAAATEGDKLVLSLPVKLPLPIAPEVHHLAVRTLGPTGERSDWSNQARIVPQAPPQAPGDVAVAQKSDGLEVTWKPVPGALGYLVYRRDAAVKTYGSALQAVVAPTVSFLDTGARIGGSYIYAVTTVTRRAPLLESAIQSERQVRYADRYPPPPVRDLVALGGEGQVRLVWTASEASDLAGYRIYRRGRDGDFRRLNDSLIQDTEWTDASVAGQTLYLYRVVAVDRSDNESEAVQAQATTR